MLSQLVQDHHSSAPLNTAQSVVAFGWTWGEYSPVQIRIRVFLLSVVTSAINIHCQLHMSSHNASSCLTQDALCSGSRVVLFLLRAFIFSSFWYKLILVSSVQRTWIQNTGGFFSDVFCQNWTFLLLNVNSGNILSCRTCLWYCHLLQSILDFCCCCEGVFLQRLCDPALLMLLSSSVLSFFSRMYQTVDLTMHKVFAVSHRD